MDEELKQTLSQLMDAMKTNGIEIGEDKTDDIKAVFEAQIGNYGKKINQGIESSRNKVLDENKKIKSKFGDEAQLEKLLKLASMVEQDEELKMIADGKHEEVFDQRLSKHKTQYEEILSNKDAEMENLIKTIEALKGDKSEMMLAQKIENFAKTAKGFKSNDKGAMEILKMVVQKDWGLNEEGELAYKTNPERLAKSGKTFDFETYITEDVQPTYGNAIFEEIEGGADLKPSEGNPYYNSGRTENLDQMGGKARDSLSDADWIAKRKEAKNR